MKTCLPHTARFTAASASVALTVATLTTFSTAPVQAKPTNPTITATAAAPTAEVGDRTLVSGVVKPANLAKGQKVTIQAKVEGSWKTVGKSTVKSSGRFSVDAKVPAVGLVKFRAKAAKVTSKSFKVTGYDWFTSSDFAWGDKVDSRSTWWYNSLSGRTVNGRTGVTTGDILGDETAGANYTVARSCDLVAAHFGIADESDPGSATITVAADGVVKWSKTFSKGTSEDVTIPVGDAIDVDLDMPGVFQTVLPAAQDLRFHCFRDPRS